VDHGDSEDVLYLDFQKTVDNTPQQRFLRDLKTRHVGVNILAWMED